MAFWDLILLSVWLMMGLRSHTEQIDNYCSVVMFSAAFQERNNSVFCHNFNYFHQLKVSKPGAVGIRRPMDEIFLYPESPSLLGASLDLIALCRYYGLIRHEFDAPMVDFSNLIGIDLDLFSKFDQINNTFFVFFVNSKFNFYLNGKPIVNCNVSLIHHIPLFEAFSQVFISQSVDLSREVCSAVFANTKMSRLMIEGMADRNILKNNRLKFSSSSLTGLNSSIESVSFFNIYRIALDNTLLDEQVFQATQSLVITGVVWTIQTELFKAFPLLKGISLQHMNLRNFFHSIPIDWMSYLNPMAAPFNQSELLSNSIYVYTNMAAISLSPEDEILIESFYPFPDSDFCLFANYPHQKFVYLILDSAKLRECSCTINWLLKYAQVYESAIEQGFIYTQGVNNSKLLKSCLSSNLNCSSTCQWSLAPSYLDPSLVEQELVSMDVDFDLIYVRYIVAIILTPICCLFGIILNCLVIRTVHHQCIHQKSEEKLTYVPSSITNNWKDEFYGFMSLNAVFNAIFCSIYLLNLMSECVIVGGVYCSSIRSGVFVQHIKIILVDCLGDVAKTCANISYFLMTLNRYNLVGKNQFEFLKLVAEKLSLNTYPMRFTLITIGIAGLINTPKLYKYQINYFSDNYDYPLLRGSNDIGDEEGMKDTFGQIAISLMILGDIINYLLTSLFNTFLEVLLVMNLRRELRDKMSKLETHKSLAKASGSTQHSRLVEKKRRNYEKADRSAMTMVIVNGIINFVLRLPEILNLAYFIIYYFVYNQKNEDKYGAYSLVRICFIKATLVSTNQVCYFVMDILKVFTVLAYSINFFVYYLFNKQFRYYFWNKHQTVHTI